MRMGWVVLLSGVLSVGCGGPLTDEPSRQDEVSAEWKRPRPELGPAFLVKDLIPDSAEQPENLVDFRGRLYFSATFGGETGLWRSDGTAPGTVPLVRLPSTGEVLDRIREVTVVRDQLFFVAHVDELWVSDGTASGTRRVKERSGGVIAFSPFGAPTAVGDTLFFFRFVTPEGGSPHTELWTSDGTPSGTVRVLDLGEGFRGSPTALGSKLFFVYEDEEHGTELWVSDGTAAGTRLVKDINPGPTGSFVSGLTPGDGELYFAATEPEHGRELWKTNGTARGTKRITDLVPGPGSAEVTPFIVFNERLYFTRRDTARNTVDLLKVKVGDSHHHRPVFLAELLAITSPNPDFISALVERPLVTKGKLFFALRTTVDFRPLRTYLWVTNGKSHGTRLLSSSVLIREERLTEPLASVGDGRIVFAAGDEAHGEEPWVSDGTPEGTRLLQDLVPGPDSSSPSQFTRSDGFIFFAASTPGTGSELWALPIPRGRHYEDER